MNHAPVIQQLSSVTLENASEAQRPLLEGAFKQVGFVPNMYANMANAPAVLSTYLHGYARFRTESGFSPAEQEVVFLAISRVNDCKYCTAAHSMVASKASGVPASVLEAIRRGTPIDDERLSVLFSLAQDLAQSRGRPCPQRVQAFKAAGYSEQQMLYVVLAIAVKTLSNYSNLLFDTPLDEAFAPFLVG
jgi:uncharacterized peroxidase-related enzyme